MIKTNPENFRGRYSFNSREWGEKIGELVITYITPPNLKIVAKGGLLGYRVTVINEGDDPVSGMIYIIPLLFVLFVNGIIFVNL